DAVCILGSVPHDTFLTLLSRSLAYIRTPMTDGTCSSVLESLELKVPVLAADNGARPDGTELWNEGDVESLLGLMNAAVEHHEEMVGGIPDREIEDNPKKLTDSIEATCKSSRGLNSGDRPSSRQLSGLNIAQGARPRQT